MDFELFKTMLTGVFLDFVKLGLALGAAYYFNDLLFKALKVDFIKVMDKIENDKSALPAAIFFGLLCYGFLQIIQKVI